MCAYKWLWPTMWELGIKPWPTARTTSTFNSQATPPVPHHDPMALKREKVTSVALNMKGEGRCVLSATVSGLFVHVCSGIAHAARVSAGRIIWVSNSITLPLLTFSKSRKGENSDRWHGRHLRRWVYHMPIDIQGESACFSAFPMNGIGHEWTRVKR